MLFDKHQGPLIGAAWRTGHGHGLGNGINLAWARVSSCRAESVVLAAAEVESVLVDEGESPLEKNRRTR